MNKRVLMTGATGNMGSLLAECLLEEGYEVTALKRSFSDMKRVRHFADKVTWFDVDKDSVEVAFEKTKPDLVVHTAICYGRQGEDNIEMMSTNFDFPFKVLNAAMKMGVKTFYNTDTVLPELLNMYALTKKCFRRTGEYFADHENIEFINLRIGHMYGHMDNSFQFVPFLIYKMIKNTPSIDLTEGVQVLDFVHVSDVVEAFLSVMKANTHKVATYDIGSGELITVRDFANMIKELSGASTVLNFGAYPYRKHEVMTSDIDITPLKELGWSPKVGLY